MKRKIGLCCLLSFFLLCWGCAGKSTQPIQEEYDTVACFEQTMAPYLVAAHGEPSKLLLDATNSGVQANRNTENGISVAEPQEFAPIELILQNPELPNGCEVTSLAMVLSSAGFPVGHVELYQNCLPTDNFSYSSGQRFGPSPEEFYVGDAASATNGWYCFETPIVEAGNAWIQQNGGGSRMESITGISQEDLDQYAQNGIPVIVWVTIGYAEPIYTDSFSWMLPNGTLYVPYNNLHCVVLAGAENGQYQIADPIYGWQAVSRDDFWNSFDAMGRRAVTIQAK